MRAEGLDVRIFSGRPPAPPPGAVEVEIGVDVPVAFGGLRSIVRGLYADAPDAVAQVAEAAPAEWNRLFPGAIRHAPDLGDLAVTPSERRLHRESEQVFRILNHAGRALLDRLAGSGRTLVLRGAGATDLVSLRGLMRAVEASRLGQGGASLWLADWSIRPPRLADSFARPRQLFLEALQRRLRVGQVEPGPEAPPTPARQDPVCLEGRYLAAALDRATSSEERIAAALLAIRACFFSTHYEGALLAAETALVLLETSSPEPSSVREAFDRLDDPQFATSTIELDRDSLGDAATLRALVHQQIGVVFAFVGDYEKALASFDRGLAEKIAPKRRAELRMYRALTLVKRLGDPRAAREELSAGLAELEGRDGPDAALQEGWLRNLGGLVCFLAKDLDGAMAEERRAIACMTGQKNPSAAHLMTNLVSNVSVLQEASKQFGDALATWRAFETVSGDWGPSFAKHHRYRRAGLRRLAGERAEVIADCEEAYGHAATLGDEFHRQAIASETGRWLLELDERAAAAAWFERAVDHARAIREPMRLAESLAGLALARRSSHLSEASRCAEKTSTYPDEAARLRKAIDSGSAEEIQRALPAPRTKLNRPFDVVNLNI